jgi:hypothetical protein
VIPPANWKPSFTPWKHSNLRFKAKIQTIGLLNGENRQELAYLTKIRLDKYLRGDPLPRRNPTIELKSGKRVNFKLRKLHVLLDTLGINFDEYLKDPTVEIDTDTRETIMGGIYECLGDVDPRELANENFILTQVVDICRIWTMERGKPTSTSFSHLSTVPNFTVSPEIPLDEFWTYTPRDDRYYKTRILSEVKKPSGQRSVPYVDISIRDDDSGRSTKFYMDEEDIDMYVKNGDCKLHAKLATKCLLCDVCFGVCGYPVDKEDLIMPDTKGVLPCATQEELEQVSVKFPAVLCSGCSITVHVNCLAPQNFSDKAILHYIASTNRDWFCSACINNGGLVGTNALKFGYQYTDTAMTRKEYEKCSSTKWKAEKRESVLDIEKNFWTLTKSGDCETTVLYASDLDSGLYAGGEFPSEYGQFPTGSNQWDLRNLALNEDSILQYLPDSSSIGGVSRPWLYLGSLYSSFCWHSEDQFLCSISYHHQGATKIWYTVPGQYRERMDECMAQLFPDLLEVNRDLTHHLVTLVDPETLSTVFGIPVGRVEQNPGEFIITFPQAYHCGFNCGVNLAEAVNVACPDWFIEHGLAAVRHYASVKRASVFSFDLLVWSVADAVLSGIETRRNVMTFVAQFLQDVVQILKRVSCGRTIQIANKTIPPACTVCYQYCFFAFCFSQEGSDICIHCATESNAPASLRFPIETIQDSIDKVLNKIAQYRDIRRSNRNAALVDTKRIRNTY